LMVQMDETDIHVVILFDEFDQVMHIPALNTAEFFGMLRSLATRHTALSLVVATTQRLIQLERETTSINPTASPYFNFINQIPMGSFSEKSIATLLDWGVPDFSLSERRVIRELAGGHPFLLQVISAAMWDAIQSRVDSERLRLEYVSRKVRFEYRDHFEDMWHRWSPHHQVAFASVALISMRHEIQLLSSRDFVITGVEARLAHFSQELGELELAGMISNSPNIRGKWQIASMLMVWWLADEINRNTRDTVVFEEWIHANELKVLVTGAEQKQLMEIFRGIGQLLETGISKFVEGYARGVAGSSFGTSP